MELRELIDELTKLEKDSEPSAPIRFATGAGAGDVLEVLSIYSSDRDGAVWFDLEPK